MILHTPPTYTPVYCQGFQTIIKDKVILSYIKTDTVGNCIKKLIEKLLLKQFFWNLAQKCALFSVNDMPYHVKVTKKLIFFCTVIAKVLKVY